jgi:hypothetical protein
MFVATQPSSRCSLADVEQPTPLCPGGTTIASDTTTEQLGVRIRFKNHLKSPPQQIGHKERRV